jgi:hypothetical protein
MLKTKIQYFNAKMDELSDSMDGFGQFSIVRIPSLFRNVVQDFDKVFGGFSSNVREHF